MTQYPFSSEEWAACMKVLTALKDDPFNNPDNQQFKTLVTAIHKKAKKEIHKTHASTQRHDDLEKLQQTTIIANAQENTTLYTHKIADTEGGYSELHTPRKCYVCNQPYMQLHFFYHRLCPDCAELNYGFRELKPSFAEFHVVITGGRVKIGYATTLKFLRAGANVLVSTRFPALAWEQLSKEPDFEDWKDKVTVYGLDLRNIKAVYQFIDFCKQTLPCVDILINNAAQTIKYPLDYYQPLIEQEKRGLLRFDNPKLLGNDTPIGLKQEQLSMPTLWEDIKTNRFGQPIDYREKNSWNSTLAEIGLEELLEVNFINHISPYILIAELSDLMSKSTQKQRFIINVTSSEGQFSYKNKTVFHPHTNMTKAALNMLTRTSAADYVEKQIYINSVDVGWISTGAHEEKRARLFDSLKIPPLDSVDGAMRIMHPILEILKGRRDLFGQLFKNYRVVEW
jgi:NAD(P)-dependent dehydrogenase (short-subunit alcohol dehydrogenase family)